MSVWLQRLLVACGLAALVVTGVSAQVPADDADDAVQETDDVGDEADAPQDDDTLEDIDDILARDEEVLYTTQGSTYDPGARRDPFRSLLQPVGEGEEEGERPEGIAGLLIDEIEIQGVFITKDGPIAQIMAASDDTSYLLRPGDQLWDGDVVRISLDKVVFKQIINDPADLKPFRDVEKKLNP